MNTRFWNTTFGKGWKYDFTKQPACNKTPGAGTYTLPSPFDKFDRKKKIEQDRQLMRRIKIRNTGTDYALI